MKNLLIAIALMFSVGANAAVEVNTAGLTDSQKAELVKQAEAMKNTVKADGKLASAEAVDKWVNVGERLGKMMGGAAKEVGLAVNDFVKTPVGQMTAFLVVWNYMGSMIVHVAGGLLIFFTTFGLLTWYSYRLREVKIVYDKDSGKNWLGNYPVLKKETSAISDDDFTVLMFGYLVSLVVSILIVFTW